MVNDMARCDCVYCGVQYAAGEFIDYCKKDQTRIEREPVYCKHRLKDNEDQEDSQRAKDQKVQIKG